MFGNAENVGVFTKGISTNAFFDAEPDGVSLLFIEADSDLDPG